MTGVTPKDLEAYFERSRTYDGERIRAAARLQKVAWTIAGVSSAAAIASLTAVIGMLPLRTVEVHVFRVDTATGVVDLVLPLKGTQTYDEAITKLDLPGFSGEPCAPGVWSAGTPPRRRPGWRRPGSSAAALDYRTLRCKGQWRPWPALARRKRCARSARI
jgi:VirB8 protein